jgi:hypothetical protein
LEIGSGRGEPHGGHLFGILILHNRPDGGR